LVPHANDINVAATLDTTRAVCRDFSDMVGAGLDSDRAVSVLYHDAGCGNQRWLKWIMLVDSIVARCVEN
jgi:hypothetical protein